MKRSLLKHAFALVGLVVVLLFGRSAGAVPVVEDKDKGIAINVGALIQPWFYVTMPGSNGGGPGACGTATRNRCSAGVGNARGDGPAFDFFLRRARLMLWGSVTNQLSYFIETDEPNLGKNGDFTVRTFVQDAFLSYTVRPELKVDAGLMLAPLSHHTLEGATSLNTLDYHLDMIKFPAQRAFRDTGVQLRGIALPGDRLQYRVAVMEGVRNAAVNAASPVPMGETRTTLNPGSVPRVVGQIRGNIFGSEPDFFLKGIYFTDKPLVSVGIGADWQSKSAIKLDGSHGDYFAGSVDVFADYPLTANDELVVKANYFYYGEGSVPGQTLYQQGASALFAEVGFRHGIIEPLVFAEVLKARKDAVSIVAPHVGANLWLMKHNFNLKTDIGYRRTEMKHDATKQDIFWTTQAQVFF
jgi:hypothetical protein